MFVDRSVEVGVTASAQGEFVDCNLKIVVRSAKLREYQPCSMIKADIENNNMQ